MKVRMLKVLLHDEMSRPSILDKVLEHYKHCTLSSGLCYNETTYGKNGTMPSGLVLASLLSLRGSLTNLAQHVIA